MKVLEPFKEIFDRICSGFSKEFISCPRVTVAVTLQNSSISQFSLHLFYAPCFLHKLWIVLVLYYYYALQHLLAFCFPFPSVTAFVPFLHVLSHSVSGF